MAEEYADATPEQKINIATYFIMSSPTGEVNDVVKDVIALVNDPAVLTDERISVILREYNTQNMVHATSPDGSEVLVTAHGQVDDNLYLDPGTGKVLKFDHRKQVFTGETDQRQVLTPEVDAQRQAIHAQLKAYCDSSYRDGKAVYGVYGTDDGRITVCISARNIKLSSYWTGGIRATYQLDVSKPGSVDMTCAVKMNVHYFEDGNVQLHTDLNRTLKVNITPDAVATAKSVVSTLDKFESEFHSHLEELYVTMHTTTFKAMRRFLPISGTPMNWNTSVHSLASEVTK